MGFPTNSTRAGTGEAVELRLPRNKVSPRAKAYWFVRALIGWIVLFAAELVWFLTGDDANAGLHVTGLVVTVVVAAAHLVIMPRWRFAVHRWEITPDAVYTRSGWIDQEWRIAPVSRIQTVDSERGVLQRLFGLSDLTVTTASSAGALKIHGLDVEVAQRAADELTGNAVASEGDAT
ncbi:PH domain-containing protein [Amycolatopsis sp.]|jgi:membrane protein YdbS with pleckstrin-like domain|uniref:PH domain-containing protein n=1 Tax=Amycolatopsis sp. TaxID=37632 RepID=UPI002DFED085|nr:PH domain-containing protein [Amycolatopsis sp.]